VIATFYDATGKIVEFETAGTSPSEISAGQSSDLMVDAVIGEWGNWTTETEYNVGECNSLQRWISGHAGATVERKIAITKIINRRNRCSIPFVDMFPLSSCGRLNFVFPSPCVVLGSYCVLFWSELWFYRLRPVL
jgi:hypothetical protein